MHWPSFVVGAVVGGVVSPIALALTLWFTKGNVQ